MMTAEEIQKLPWAAHNIPPKWDFRNKTAEDLVPLCFGVFYKDDDPGLCKIIYGGQDRAERAVEELRLLGIEAILNPPTDHLIDDDVRIKGWCWSVRFRPSTEVNAPLPAK